MKDLFLVLLVVSTVVVCYGYTINVDSTHSDSDYLHRTNEEFTHKKKKEEIDINDKNGNITQTLERLLNLSFNRDRNTNLTTFVRKLEENIRSNLTRMLNRVLEDFDDTKPINAGLHRFKRDAHSTCVALATAIGQYGGGTIGGTAGASLGSAIPIVGTIIGAYFGAIYGSQFGATFAQTYAAQFCPESNQQNQIPQGQQPQYGQQYGQFFGGYGQLPQQ